MIDGNLIERAMSRAQEVLSSVTQGLGVRGQNLTERPLSEKDQLQRFLNMKDEDHQALIRRYGQADVSRYMATMRDLAGRV